ncbi:MAG: YggS family pyridoxal phosphate-dependent enzyme [Nitrospirae bacterium]|nr:YggS family pyridoxal phosphate-dependent enzyme [Nitrospirota bacterium]
MNTKIISAILKKMSSAAMKADRCPSEVNLIAVTKTVGLDAITEAARCGLRLFGESRVQEACSKIEQFKVVLKSEKICGVEWHLIGHLQSNKAKLAVSAFDFIHSVDSIALAEELDRQAFKAGKVQRILVQVKLAEEDSKQGIREKELRTLLERIKSFKNIDVKGLMTIPPYFDNPENSREYFKRLYLLRESLQNTGFLLPELSMGMSHDFEVAIEEGATMVRVGTAIFGERRN